MALFVETACPNEIPNGNLSDTCIDSKVGDHCDNFTCDSGFEATENVGQFSCTEDGTWDYDLTTLCIGNSCLSQSIMFQSYCGLTFTIILL